MSRNLDRQLNVKFPEKDLDHIHEISNKFDLPSSEVVRRALREGLRRFEKAKIPGSPVDKEDG